MLILQDLKGQLDQLIVFVTICGEIGRLLYIWLLIHTFIVLYWHKHQV